MAYSLKRVEIIVFILLQQEWLVFRYETIYRRQVPENLFFIW
jgi:hypothetical protein